MLNCARTSSIAFVLVATALPAFAQTEPATPKLGLTADLVLTKDFCTSELKRGSWTTGKEKFEIGKKLCPALAQRLPSIFTSLKQLDQMPAPNADPADVILVPKLVDSSATRATTVFQKRDMLVELEWTALSPAGKTLWIETVEGDARRSMGNGFTHGIEVRKINEDVVNDAVEKSLEKISTAPELTQLQSGAAPRTTAH